MKNNLSTGIDIVSINRIKEILTSSKRERFLKKIFSSNEIKEAKSRHNEAQFFSGRFAAKEAVRKATSTPENSSKLTFKSIEIFNMIAVSLELTLKTTQSLIFQFHMTGTML